MSTIKISGVIIASNAERTLRRCLESLAALDEVIVYENGSTDRTAEIARSFPNVRLVIGDFTGYGPTKNRAAEEARNDWILSVDSDEAVSPELIGSIAALDLSDTTVVYAVDRHNYMYGKHVRHAGWGNDWLPRLYNRSRFRYNDAMVHENLEIGHATPVSRLQGPLLHEAVIDLSQFLVKIDRYTELRKDSGARAYGPFGSLVKAAWAFFRSYVLQLGLLDGWRGVVIAYSDATGVFFRCMKCYARDLGDDPTRSGP